MSQAASLLGAARLLASGCTTQIRAGAPTNPPPEAAFNRYARFELRPVGIASQYANQSGNEDARAKIRNELELRPAPMLAAWAEPGDNVRVVEPVLDEIRFINGDARFRAGPMAGSSAVIMSVTCRDGVTDNLMLIRIAELAAKYTQANYENAVGGPTGADESRVVPDPASAAN